MTAAMLTKCVVYGSLLCGMAGCTVSLIRADSRGPMSYPSTCGAPAWGLTLDQAARRDIPVFDTSYPRGDRVWDAKRWCTNPIRYRIADVRFIRTDSTNGEIAMGITGSDGMTRYIKWSELGSEWVQREMAIVTNWNPSAAEAYRIILKRARDR